MTTKRLAICSAVIAFAVVACHEPPLQPQVGLPSYVSAPSAIRILEARTGDPIVGATLSLGAARAISDSAGRVTLPDGPPGLHVLVRAVGFLPFHGEVVVLADGSAVVRLQAPIGEARDAVRVVRER